jgi:hypothetical protein
MPEPTQITPRLDWFGRARLKAQKPAKETPRAVRKAIEEAKKQGLSVAPSGLMSPYQLYISAKRCHIMQTKPVGRPTTARLYIPLNLPRSGWAEFLIYFSRAGKAADTGDFYVVPRQKLPKHTSVPSTSTWLAEYACAWHLLKTKNHPVPAEIL